jgi:hypothetical protein
VLFFSHGQLMTNRRLRSLALLLLLLLAGCRPDGDGLPAADTSLSTPVVETLAAATPVVVASPPPAATSQVFVPMAGAGAAASPTAEPEALVVPTAAATVTPAPPSPTPEPEYPVYTGPPLDRDKIGVQFYLHRQDVRDLLRHFDALDAGWAKVQVSWKLHEPRPGEYNAELFDELDRIVDGTQGDGVKLLLSVSKAPEWSRPVTEEDGPPADTAEFERFMAYLAGRYAGKVDAYELWNEPNLRREWNGAPLDPAALVELTRRGAAGVCAADPAALIISAPPAVTGINDGVNAIDDRQYLAGMLAAGVAGVVDGIGVHPYGWANPPDSRAADPAQESSSHNNHPSFFFADTMNDYHDLLVSAGAGDKPLWATEFGWATFEDLLTTEGAPASPPAGVEYMAEVSEWEQAVYTLRAYEMAQAWPWAGPMFLWNLNFTSALGPEFPEVGYSLLRFDGSRRPAYRALEHRDGE